MYDFWGFPGLKTATNLSLFFKTDFSKQPRKEMYLYNELWTVAVLLGGGFGWGYATIRVGSSLGCILIS